LPPGRPLQHFYVISDIFSVLKNSILYLSQNVFAGGRGSFFLALRLIKIFSNNWIAIWMQRKNSYSEKSKTEQYMDFLVFGGVRVFITCLG
jgi:hypothetical protein